MPIVAYVRYTHHYITKTHVITQTYCERFSFQPFYNIGGNIFFLQTSSAVQYHTFVTPAELLTPRGHSPFRNNSRNPTPTIMEE